MRRSREVPLTLLAAIALSATACRDTRSETRNCVDAQGHIVPDTNCEHRGGGAYVPYHYLYGGVSGGRVGDSVVGGRSAPAGAEEGGVSRGGFGHGGGEGGGE